MVQCKLFTRPSRSVHRSGCAAMGLLGVVQQHNTGQDARLFWPFLQIDTTYNNIEKILLLLLLNLFLFVPRSLSFLLRSLHYELLALALPTAPLPSARSGFVRVKCTGYAKGSNGDRERGREEEGRGERKEKRKRGAKQAEETIATSLSLPQHRHRYITNPPLTGASSGLGLPDLRPCWK